MRGQAGFTALVAGIWLLSSTGPYARDAFVVTEIESGGRTVAAEFADLNGDGRGDLLQWTVEGYPPEEERWILVYLQDGSGRIPEKPSARWPLPPGVAAYDLADLLPEPGVELVLLRAPGVRLLSLGGERPRSVDLSVPGAPTLGVAVDERGLERLPLVHADVSGEPWLWVPLPGRAVALSPSGELRAQLQVGIRANYLIPPPGPLLFESGLQIYLDAPRLEFGDVDGDGRIDVITSARHELRVFLQRADGSLGESPDRVLPLRRVSTADLLRGSGAVRVQVSDANTDGKPDLLVSYLSGGVLDPRTLSSLHLNQDGGWDLQTPDQSFEAERSWTSDWLSDMDADGRSEWVRVSISLSLPELVEMLLTRSLDAKVEVYRPDPAGLFETEPTAQRELSVPIDFGSYRPRGFTPTLEADLNQDGHRDLLASGAGDEIEVFLGGPGRNFRKRNASQPMDTRGRIRFGDVTGDGLTDLLIFDPRRPDAPLRVARNTGALVEGGAGSDADRRPAD